MRRFLRIVFTCAVCVLLAAVCAAGVKRTDTASKYGTYRKRADYCDVLFFGSSHVLNAVFPMLLWGGYGITSYNMAYHSLSVAQDAELLNLALCHHVPKVAVIDILSVDKDNTGGVEDAHNALDPFPLSVQKWRSVCSLYDDTSSRAQLAVPFVLYHERWKELGVRSLLGNARRLISGSFADSVTNGADPRIGVAEDIDFEGMRSVCPYEGNRSVGMEALLSFVGVCQQNQIVPVVMLVPYPDQVYLDEWKAALVPLLEELDVAFLDMSEGIVDFTVDRYDLNSHLNPSGARKVTDCIGRFLSLNHLAPDRRGNPDFDCWNGWYERYCDQLVSSVRRQKDFKRFLMMLNAPELSAHVVAGENVRFDSVEETLLFGNTNAPDVTLVTDSAAPDDVTVTVLSSRTGEVLFEKRFSLSLVPEP